MAQKRAFLEKLCTRAPERSLRRILLPEARDARVQEAAKILSGKKIAAPILVEIDESRAGKLQKLLLELRSSKGLTQETAITLARDPLIFAMYLLREGEADGLVAGATRPTADVLRAGLWLIGKAKGIETVSSAMYMVLSGSRDGDERVLTFADCAVVPEPTAAQLADIAIAAADARSRVVGDEPRVALLSYSTKGSGTGTSVERVRTALELVKQKRPKLLIDGEIQVDAALDATISERKAPGSALHGKANVLVFPSLDAANIGYKLVAHLVPGAQALGPILQGFNKPISDLSRGVSAEEIVQITAIVASQCES